MRLHNSFPYLLKLLSSCDIIISIHSRARLYFFLLFLPLHFSDAFYRFYKILLQFINTGTIQLYARFSRANMSFRCTLKAYVDMFVNMRAKQAWLYKYIIKTVTDFADRSGPDGLEEHETIVLVPVSNRGSCSV